jgi:PAS domain S-box-containing protein
MSAKDRRADGAPRTDGAQLTKELEQLYEHAPVGLALLDRELRFIRVNEVFAGFAGGTATPLSGLPLAEKFPLVGEAIKPLCERALESGAPVLDVEVESPPASQPGQWKYWLLSCHPVRGADGAVAGIHLVLQDTTDRKRAELCLYERMRFETVLADLSSRFVNLSAAETDREIAEDLRRIAAALDVEWIVVLRLSPDTDRLAATHSWVAEGASIAASVDFDRRYPYAAKSLRAGEIVAVERPDEIPEATGGRKRLADLGLAAVLILPITMRGEIWGGMGIGAPAPRTWPEPLVGRLRVFGEIIASAVARAQSDRDLARSYEEIRRLKDRLQVERDYLETEIKVTYNHDEIIGESDAIKHVLRLAEQVADKDTTVLLLGETGTGKELIARVLHKLSPRNVHPMVKVNCAALPATLIESELFGREKGAYSGAVTSQPGRFEVADGSTLFLDEVGDLPLELQAKLLRVLQEGEFERLGSSKPIRVNVRIIAATNRDLARGVREGTFREDLYYRLNVFPIVVPPLRERRDDIPPLVWGFVKSFEKSMGKKIEAIAGQTMEALKSYAWPGNIRELRNVVERAMILTAGTTLVAELPGSQESTAAGSGTLEDMERSHIQAVLERTAWRIRGKDGAAQILGLKPSTLYSRLKKLGIEKKPAGGGARP